MSTSPTERKFAAPPFAAPDSPPRALVMGVINVTPDSFSDGNTHFDTGVAISAGLRMIEEGADIIDVGGESTRPGSDQVTVEEELARAIPVIRGILLRRPNAIISVDTRRRAVAEAAIGAGAKIINDVSGFRDDPGLVEIGRKAGAGMVIMHMLGRPKTMQADIRYDSFPGDIYKFLEERVRALEKSGIDPDKIVIDPGIGFGKTFDQNLILLNRLDYFFPLGKPILVGASRKAFLGRILDQPVASARDLGSMAAVVAAVLRGASVVRVHDVASAVQVCKVADAIARERVEP